ncbi:hypothetical protein HNY73_016343 [Argiope bruennichi]|uniref:MYND-type domain-containing protein n=1 Tax=Argiope bruennichi TaxID=94029 RepID=A0A8T0END5_ARGBR|nr:hypothetical protein HNY73_016343 [Argiope bruennichi]
MKDLSKVTGSVVVDFVITGLTEDLDKTSEALSNDINSGKADIEYVKGTVWKAKSDSFPSRKLLENTNDGQSDEGGGGLSVAWIVAIVINVILIVVFIFAIIYCWHRRKKQNDSSRSGSALQNFDGQPEAMMFANKADIKKKSMEEKAALMDSGHRGTNIFTIENGRKHLVKHKHHEDDDERCNCYSPACYCSVGDGRKTDSRLGRSVEDENVDDPQGYPTPSPQRTFPTPEPTPEPEDFWRPDTYQQEEEEEEEPFHDSPLPGAIPEPEPEPEKPIQERYYVYQVLDSDGSRELIGNLYLEVDSFLDDVRRAIDRDRNLSEAIRRKEYKFLDENLDEVPAYEESSLDLDRIFPSQEINIQCIQPEPKKPPDLNETSIARQYSRTIILRKPKLEKMPKIPAYVGPLGICSASDCTKAAKIKCLDCRNTAYCSKRCMREDIKEHKRVCYKPAWRL